MKKTYKNVLLSLCAISLLAGCASKDLDGSSSYQSGGSKTSADTANTANNSVDNISGYDEQVVEDYSAVKTDIVNNEVESDANYISKYQNKTNSIIDGKTISLNSIHFDFDKYNLSSSMRAVATTNSSKISKVSDNYNSLKIKLEGNCDEWGTDEYNYALGLKRAKATKDALIADGIEEDRIMLISFGESNPICSEKNKDCWKMNRRVDYKLLP